MRDVYELLESIFVEWIYVKGESSGTVRSRNASQRRLRVVEDRNVNRYDFMYRTPQNALRVKGELRAKAIEKIDDDKKSEIDHYKVQLDTGRMDLDEYTAIEEEINKRYAKIKADRNEQFEKEDRAYRRTEKSLFRYCLELGVFDVVRTGGKLRCKTNHKLDGIPLGKLSAFINALNNDRMLEEKIVIKDDVRNKFNR